MFTVRHLTSNELRNFLNEKFGINTKWPPVIGVDEFTFAKICQEIFKEVDHTLIGTDKKVVQIILGPNNGIMFKGVELILREWK